MASKFSKGEHVVYRGREAGSEPVQATVIQVIDQVSYRISDKNGKEKSTRVEYLEKINTSEHSDKTPEKRAGGDARTDFTRTTSCSHPAVERAEDRSHVRFNSRIHVRRVPAGPGKGNLFAGARQQVLEEYSTQLNQFPESSGMSPPWYGDGTAAKEYPRINTPNPGNGPMRIDNWRLDMWRKEGVRICVGSEEHCSLLMRFDGKTVTTQSGSMYALTNRDPKVQTVMSFLLANMVDAPVEDPLDPLSTTMWPVQLFAGTAVYGGADSNVKYEWGAIEAGMSLLTNTNAYGRAKPRHSGDSAALTEAFDSLMQMASLMGSSCFFEAKIEVHVDEPRGNPFRRAFLVTLPAKCTMEKLLAYVYGICNDCPHLTKLLDNYNQSYDSVAKGEVYDGKVESNMYPMNLGILDDPTAGGVQVHYSQGRHSAADMHKTLAALNFGNGETVSIFLKT